MNSKVSMIKPVLVAVALAAVTTGIARADDSSMSRFGGDSYTYFDTVKPNNAPSAWRQANPKGLSERQLQALSSESPEYQLQAPVFDKARSTWRQSHPHGLSERELQALSSESPVWQLPTQSTTGALASTTETAAVTTAAR